MNRCNSSGKLSQDSQRREFSTRFSISKEGSASRRCSMTLIGGNEETKTIVLRIASAHSVTEYARRFTRGRWPFLGLGSEKKWYGTHVSKFDWQCDKNAEHMMLNFAESGHPILRATSALERGELKSKRKWMKSIHFNGSDETIELFFEQLFQSISSVSTQQ